MTTMFDPPWLRYARADVGNTETLGPNDGPWIRRMWAKLSGSWLLGQPWCGGAVAYWMERAAVPHPKAYYRAKAWLDWGVPIEKPTVGAVVIFEREGGGHVGIVTGQDTSGRLLVVGGNQGDKVCEAPFIRSRALGYRWPRECISQLRHDLLPITTAQGRASTNEA